MSWVKLKEKDLRISCKIRAKDFKTTAEVPPLEEMVGQDRAVKATEFGLRIKRPGYNIFMTGLTGTGKSSYAQSIIQNYRQKNRFRMTGSMSITLKTRGNQLP